MRRNDLARQTITEAYYTGTPVSSLTMVKIAKAIHVPAQRYRAARRRGT